MAALLHCALDAYLEAMEVTCNEEKSWTLKKATELFWDRDPVMRLAKLAKWFPDLARERELELWDAIAHDRACWLKIDTWNEQLIGKITWSTGPKNIDTDAVRERYGRRLARL